MIKSHFAEYFGYRLCAFYGDNGNIVAGNFYYSPLDIHINGKSYSFQCAEAAYQAHKFINYPHIIYSFTNCDGKGAYKCAKFYSKYQCTSWHKNKWSIMLNILFIKFSDKTLKQLLLTTGKRYLIEHAPVKGRDSYWADDFDGSGKNQLGIALMITRQKLGGYGIVDLPQEYFDKICGKQLSHTFITTSTNQTSKNWQSKISTNICIKSDCNNPTWNGYSGQFCSKTCRNPANLCIKTGCNNPTWNGNPGQFCSKTCRNSANLCIKTGCNNPTWNGKPGQFCSKMCRNSSNLCIKNGCNNPTWNGKPGQFCSKTCKYT